MGASQTCPSWRSAVAEAYEELRVRQAPQVSKGQGVCAASKEMLAHAASEAESARPDRKDRGGAARVDSASVGPPHATHGSNPSSFGRAGIRNERTAGHHAQLKAVSALRRLRPTAGRNQRK